MSDEMELRAKDSIKLNILKAVLNGEIGLLVAVNDGRKQDYASQIHSEGSRVRVCGGFNLSESPDMEILTVRPTSEGASIRLYFSIPEGISDKRISLFRSAVKSIESELPLDSSVVMIALSDNGRGGCILSLCHAEPPQPDQRLAEEMERARLERSIADAEKRQRDLERLKKSSAERLAVMEQEYNRDHEEYLREVEELRSRVNVDAAVIEYYKDKNITPTESLLNEIRARLDEAEAQIRFFIEAKQKKTMEIENQVKSENKV